jgi:hypothetical protein
MTTPQHDIFSPGVTEGFVARIRALTPDAEPRWGKMNVAQMLAHCSVVYEMIYEDRHRRPGPVVRWLLRLFLKPQLLSEKPFPRNAPTAPAFKVSPSQDFEGERDRLIAYLERTRDLGGDAFEGRDNFSFGPMTRGEWSRLFEKHLDHHLTQFGV